MLFIPVAVCRRGGGGVCVTRSSVFKELLHGYIYSLLLFLNKSTEYFIVRIYVYATK